MASEIVRTPDCPECGMPPVHIFDDMRVCGNILCRILTWTPSKTIAENLSDVGNAFE